MQEQPLIHGVKNEEERADVTEALNEWAENARVPLEGEQPKTEEELKMIQIINSFIAEEFERLGVRESFIPIDPEQVHLLSWNVFEKKYGKTLVFGSANSGTQAIYINKDFDPSPNAIFARIFHEMLHLASHQKFYFNRETHVIQDYRVGYGQTNQEEEDEFRGFNEFLTDAAVFSIWGRHIGDLNAGLSFTEDEANNTPLAYFTRYMSLFREILFRVAEKRNETPGETADRFTKGMFTGEMMHLRDIEKIYGENALRVLSLLGKKDVSKDEMENVDQKVKEYFHETDEGKRKAIAEELLTKYKHDK